MYQQVQTRPTPAAPSRSRWQLAGRQVTQAMFYDAEKAKRSGRRVIFVTAGESETTRFAGAGDDCENCSGFGTMGLEVIVAGPFQNAPQGKTGTADEAPVVHFRPAWHNGAWWQVVRSMYPCPVCNDSREVQL